LDETTYQDDDCNDSNRKNKTQYRSGASLEWSWPHYKDDFGSDIESDDNM
jgi:hypothetical protein